MTFLPLSTNKFTTSVGSTKKIEFIVDNGDESDTGSLNNSVLLFVTNFETENENHGTEDVSQPCCCWSISGVDGNPTCRFVDVSSFQHYCSVTGLRVCTWCIKAEMGRSPCFRCRLNDDTVVSGNSLRDVVMPTDNVDLENQEFENLVIENNLPNTGSELETTINCLRKLNLVKPY